MQLIKLDIVDPMTKKLEGASGTVPIALLGIGGETIDKGKSPTAKVATAGALVELKRTGSQQLAGCFIISVREARKRQKQHPQVCCVRYE